VFEKPNRSSLTFTFTFTLTPIPTHQVGWNGVRVANGRIGGWRLQITFVANPGDFVAPVTAPRSIAFPPGSLARDPLVATHGALTPAAAFTTVSSSVTGATPLGGTFTVALMGENTASIPYAAPAGTVEDRINALWNAEAATVSRMWVACPTTHIHAPTHLHPDPGCPPPPPHTHTRAHPPCVTRTHTLSQPASHARVLGLPPAVSLARKGDCPCVNAS
jgi:hypothetical protein